jgi:hypothetical protein
MKEKKDEDDWVMDLRISLDFLSLPQFSPNVFPFFSRPTTTPFLDPQ